MIKFKVFFFLLFDFRLCKRSDMVQIGDGDSGMLGFTNLWSDKFHTQVSDP